MLIGLCFVFYRIRKPTIEFSRRGSSDADILFTMVKRAREEDSGDNCHQEQKVEDRRDGTEAKHTSSKAGSHVAKANHKEKASDSGESSSGPKKVNRPFTSGKSCERRGTCRQTVRSPFAIFAHHPTEDVEKLVVCTGGMFFGQTLEGVPKGSVRDNAYLTQRFSTSPGLLRSQQES